MGNCLGRDGEGVPPPRNEPPSSTKKGSQGVPLALCDLPGKAKTGDLLVLVKGEETHYGIILKDKEVSPRTPLLVARPVKNEDGSYGLRVSTVNYTVVYQGYTQASLRSLNKPVEFNYDQAQSLPSTTAKNDTAKGLLMQVYSSALGLQLAEEDPEVFFPDKLPLAAPVKVSWTAYKIGPLAEEGQTFKEHLLKWTTDDVSDQPHKSMEEVSVNLKAGDILLSAGIGVGGAIIRVADGSDFSHVAIIVDDPYIDEPCIWESTTNTPTDTTDLDTGKVVRGVSLVPFTARCRMGWDGPIAVRHLTDISDKKREEIKEKLTSLRCHLQGRAYEENLGELLKAKFDFGEEILPFLRGKRGEAAMETIFCSELISCSYLACGLLKPGKPASEYTPGDFTSSADPPVEILQGTLQKELFVKLPFGDNA